MLTSDPGSPTIDTSTLSLPELLRAAAHAALHVEPSRQLVARMAELLCAAAQTLEQHTAIENPGARSAGGPGPGRGGGERETGDSQVKGLLPELDVLVDEERDWTEWVCQCGNRYPLAFSVCVRCHPSETASVAASLARGGEKTCR